MVKFKGINHLAMVTGDMEKTVKFDSFVKTPRQAGARQG